MPQVFCENADKTGAIFTKTGVFPFGFQDVGENCFCGFPCGLCSTEAAVFYGERAGNGGEHPGRSKG